MSESFEPDTPRRSDTQDPALPFPDAGADETTETPATPSFPWPPAERAPILDALITTWREATFHPAAFFRSLPARASVGPPILFYLVIGIIAAALQLFWSNILPQSESSVSEMLGTSAASPLVDFLMSPLLLLVSLYIAAGVTHLMVLALVPGNRGFNTTLRIFCFAYSPALFNIVPWLGPIAAFVWMTALSVIGIRAAHETSTGRALTAVLVPLLIGAVFVGFAFLLLKSGALLVPQ